MLSGLRRAGRTLAATVVVLGTTSACGSLSAPDHPEEAAAAAATSGFPAGTSAPATPTPSGPTTIAQGNLVGGDGRPAGTLVVTAGRVQTGLVLPFSQFAEDCPVDGPSLQFVPVTFRFTLGGAAGGLAAHLTVTPGPATPADIGDVGVFFEPASPDERY